MSQVEQRWKIVNKSGVPIGSATKHECRTNRLITRRVALAVYDNASGHLLMEEIDLHERLYRSLLRFPSEPVFENEEDLETARRVFRKRLGGEPGDLILRSSGIYIPEHPSWTALFRTAVNTQSSDLIKLAKGLRFHNIEYLYRYRELIIPSSQKLLDI